MLAGHQGVLGGDLRRVPEPLGDRVGRVPLHPVGFAGGPEVLEQPRPGLVSAVLSEISDDWETERSYLNMKAR